MSNYIPHTAEDVEVMLSSVGMKSLENLYQGLEQFFTEGTGIGKPKSQQEVEIYFNLLSQENKVYPSIFLGGGAYNHYIPAVVKSLVAREEFLTAYTPYQAELSQGILQSIFEYQSMITRLTGLDISNASHYDGSTALAEGVMMLEEKNKNKVLLSRAIHPERLKVIETYLRPHGIEISYIELENGKTSIKDLKEKLSEDVFAVAISQPNYYGMIEDAEEIGNILSVNKTGYIMNVEPISQCLLKTPFECNADIAAGEGQPLGLPLSFGGPYLGFIAAKQKYVRKMTGRIVGKTTDKDGKDAYVLTLQAREQHIRREKATSSICSNQAFCALTATIYMAVMGKKGMKEVASQCLSKAHYLAAAISNIKGYKMKYSGEFFNEFVIESDIKADVIIDACEKNEILAGLKLSDHEILWCATEMNGKSDMDKLISILAEVK